MAREKSLFAEFRVIDKPKAAPAASGIPGEVVAAIAGAVAVVCGQGAAITGIKPAVRRGQAGGRAAWGMAGLLENTRPF